MNANSNAAINLGWKIKWRIEKLFSKTQVEITVYVNRLLLTTTHSLAFVNIVISASVDIEWEPLNERILTS